MDNIDKITSTSGKRGGKRRNGKGKKGGQVETVKKTKLGKVSNVQNGMTIILSEFPSKKRG